MNRRVCRGPFPWAEAGGTKGAGVIFAAGGNEAERILFRRSVGPFPGPAVSPILCVILCKENVILQQTNHYQLNQWDFADRIQMEDFNSDNQKTDEALHTLAGQIAGKADSTTVSALTARVNAKAEQGSLTAEQTARINADSAEKAAREAADSAQLETLRAENLWVKLGEATLKQAGPQMSITAANAERYARFFCQYTLHGPKVVCFSLGTGYPLDLFELEGYNSILSVGTMDIICCGSAALLRTQSSTNDGQHTWGHSDSSLRADSALSGSTVFKVYTRDENFASGAHMVLYGLKK